MENSDAMDKRLRRMERELRLWRVGFLVVALIVLVVSAERQSKVVTAREFVLIDPAGTVKATLGFDAAQRPQLLLHGNGRVQASLRPELLSLGGGDDRVAIGAYGKMAFATIDSGDRESSVWADEKGASVFARICGWREMPPSARVCEPRAESKLISANAGGSVEVSNSSNKRVWSAP